MIYILTTRRAPTAKRVKNSIKDRATKKVVFEADGLSRFKSIPEEGGGAGISANSD